MSKKHKKDYLNVPVELCRYTLSNHLITTVTVFMFLKSKCSGQIKLPPERIEIYSNELGIKSTKTFRKHLNWLISKEWVIFIEKCGVYQLKSLVSIANELNFTCIRGAIFEPIDFEYFKPFMIAAVIQYYMLKKSRKQRRSVYINGNTRNVLPNPAFLTLPHTYLAKILKISKSLAANYRSIAVNSGYIISKHTYEELNIPATQKESFKKYCYDSQNLKVKNGKLAIQTEDILQIKIFLRTITKFKRHLIHTENFCTDINGGSRGN